MDEETKKEILERFEALPKDIQNVILSSDYPSKVATIAEKFLLSEEQQTNLSNEAMFVMIGLERPNSFVENVHKSLGIPTDKANLIATEVNQKVFLEIREALKQVHPQETADAAPPEVILNRRTFAPPPSPRSNPLMPNGFIPPSKAMPPPTAPPQAPPSPFTAPKRFSLPPQKTAFTPPAPKPPASAPPNLPSGTVSSNNSGTMWQQFQRPPQNTPEKTPPAPQVQTKPPLAAVIPTKPRMEAPAPKPPVFTPPASTPTPPALQALPPQPPQRTVEKPITSLTPPPPPPARPAPPQRPVWQPSITPFGTPGKPLTPTEKGIVEQKLTSTTAALREEKKYSTDPYREPVE